MSNTDSTSIEEQVQELLDTHAEYYIKETMKFFQENGESPALSKDNKGDLTAKNQILELFTKQNHSIIQKLLAELPNKKDPSLASMDWLRREMEGFNQALDQTKLIIERYL